MSPEQLCRRSVELLGGRQVPHGGRRNAGDLLAVSRGRAADEHVDLEERDVCDGSVCHQATVTANRYQSYYKPGTTRTLPGGDWQGGLSYPGSTLIGSPNQFVTVTEIDLHRSGANNLVTSTTSTS